MEKVKKTRPRRQRRLLKALPSSGQSKSVPPGKLLDRGGASLQSPGDGAAAKQKSRVSQSQGRPKRVPKVVNKSGIMVEVSFEQQLEIDRMVAGLYNDLQLHSQGAQATRLPQAPPSSLPHARRRSASPLALHWQPEDSRDNQQGKRSAKVRWRSPGGARARRPAAAAAPDAQESLDTPKTEEPATTPAASAAIVPGLRVQKEVIERFESQREEIEAFPVMQHVHGGLERELFVSGIRMPAIEVRPTDSAPMDFFIRAVPVDSPAKRPCLIYLHGKGSAANSYSLRGLARDLFWLHRCPEEIIVVIPQLLQMHWVWEHPLVWKTINDFVMSLQDSGLDPERVYMTGHSIGGMACWHFACLSVEEDLNIAAIVPLGGGFLFGQSRTVALVDFPVWTFHGDYDREVPLEADDLGCSILFSAGANRGSKVTFKFSRYEWCPSCWPQSDDAHACDFLAFAEESLWEWLLQQRRDSVLAHYRWEIGKAAWSDGWSKALMLYEEMQEKGLEPDIHTRGHLLCACARGSLMQEAFALVQDTRTKGLELQFTMYISAMRKFKELMQWTKAQEVLQMVTSTRNVIGAISQGRADLVKFLCAAGVDNRMAMPDGWTPLHAAAFEGDVDVVRYLCRAGLDTQRARSDGATPLLTAALNGHVAVVQFLCEARADLEKASRDGTTPLFAGAINGHEATVAYLCRARANLEAPAQEERWTPLCIAAWSNCAGIVELLCEAGAERDGANGHGWTPLFTAAWRGHTQVVRYLCDLGADRDRPNRAGATPMHAAAENGHAMVLCDLIEIPQNQGLRDGTHRSDNALLFKRLQAADDSEATPLHLAAASGHTEVVRYLCEKGAEKDMRDSSGETPLSAAARGGDPAVVQFLCDQGADVDATSSDGAAPLVIAALAGHLEVVELLCKAGASQSADGGWGPLRAAAGMGHAEVVSFLCSQGMNATEAAKDGSTPILLAAQGGHTEVAKLLVQARADPSNAANKGVSPLLAAAEQGHAELAEYLCSLGVDKEAGQAEGETPLFAAARSGHAEVVRCLCDAGAEPDRPGGEGVTPVHAAAAGGHLEVVQYLCERGADLSRADESGATPLLAACFWGHGEVVRHLCEVGGVDPQQAQHLGWTALHVAAAAGHLDVARLLLGDAGGEGAGAGAGASAGGAGAGAEAVTNEGETALLLASREGHAAVVEYLCQRGAELHRASAAGLKPLHEAAAAGHVAVARQLCEAGADVQGPTTAPGGQTPLLVAEGAGHYEVAQLLRDWASGPVG